MRWMLIIILLILIVKACSAQIILMTPNPSDTVEAGTPQNAYINLSRTGGTTVSGWNNLLPTDPESIDTMTWDLSNSSGEPLSWDFTSSVESNTWGIFSSSGASSTGGGTGGINDLFPATVRDSYWYTNGGGGTREVVCRISNLNVLKTYTLYLFGARSASGSRITRYTPIGASVGSNYNLECVNNTANYITITGIVPHASGYINISTVNTNNQFGYLNGIIIIEE